MIILWLLGGVFLLLAVRVPVAFSLLLPSLIYLGLEPRLTLGIGLQRVTAMLDSFPLLAVPLFILVGYVANVAGLADRLIEALLAIMGRVRGSLAYVNINASLAFSWMSGSSMADAAAMGSVLIPAMRRNGYDPAFAAAITAASSMIGPVMPPSIAAILYGVLSGSSIAAMFLAGVLPALLIFLSLTVYVYFYVRKRDGLVGEPYTRSETLRAVLTALPILVAPIVLLGGILGGVFTPTEASGITVVYLIAISFALRWMSLTQLYRAFALSASTTGRVMLIAAAGGLFSYVLAREGVPQQITELLQLVTDDPLIFLLLLNVFLLVVGMFLEPSSALLITVPVLFPVAQQFGIDPIHLGAVVILNLTLGLLTPPIGLVLFMLSSVGGVPFKDVLRATLPLLIPLFATLLLVTYLSDLSLMLPRLFGFR
ncbi:MAG: TRAP transporter large permease [Tistlia sp.]|uniref:TRAP transporter large permease n=1 Tax=Tistlia sp. TaxID=3057121 RepID=UPI0034A3E42A